MSLFEVSSTWLDERYARCYVWAATPERARELGKAYLDRAWNLRDTTVLQVVVVSPLRQHEDYPLIMDSQSEEKIEQSAYEAFCAFFGLMGMVFDTGEEKDPLVVYERRPECRLWIRLNFTRLWFAEDGRFLGLEDCTMDHWGPRIEKGCPCPAEGS